jgi:CRISPR-associated endonuclease Cas3-HD
LSKTECACYAYRDVSSGLEEDLVEHLLGVASCCAEERWETRALASKLSRVLGLGLDMVRDAILLAGLLHDVGKAAQVYQEPCQSGGCTEFHGHYLVSAFIAHLALSLSGTAIRVRDAEEFLGSRGTRLGEDKVFAVLIVLPIAFHHYHQVRGTKSYSAVHRSTVGNFLDNPLIYGKCVESFEKIISHQGVGPRGREVLEKVYAVLTDIGSYVESDSYRDSKLFILRLGDLVRSGLRDTSITLGKAVVEAVMGVVNLCDGIVAARKRR